MIFGRDMDGVQWVKPNDFGDSQTLNSVAPKYSVVIKTHF